MLSATLFSFDLEIQNFLYAQVWDGVITHNSCRSPCIKLYCILNPSLSLSFFLSLSCEEHNVRNTCYFFAYAKKCTCTCAAFVKIGLEKVAYSLRTFQQKDFLMPFKLTT